MSAEPSESKLMSAEAVESLFVRVLGPRLGGEGRRRLKEAGLDLEQPLRAVYALERWRAFLRIAASEAFPRSPPQESYLELGRLYLRGWLQRLREPGLHERLRRLGPRYALEQVVAQVRVGNNFNEMRLQELGEESATVWVRDVAADNPLFTCGLLHEGLSVAGAEQVEVAPVAFDGTAATLRAAWRSARGAGGLAAGH